MTESAASKSFVSAVRSVVARRPAVTSASQSPRSGGLLLRQPLCCDAADGPSPTHSCICQVLRLCRHAWPGRVKFETSYCAKPAAPR